MELPANYPCLSSNPLSPWQVLKEHSFASYDWSYILAWIGVGWALVSAVLFSSAAICLRGEREREEAVNMQYLMPGNPRPHL